MLLKRIQLGLIHAAVAMTLVPINSTLNRVMIKEMAISATLVAILASLPYLLSPIQVVIGSFADRHPFRGYRRTPYILLGLALCVLGVVGSPLVAFLIGENFWLGIAVGVLAFGAWGMGFNFATVSYLSLASEISGEKDRGKTISVMFFIMILSIIVTALGLSRLLEPYSQGMLVRAFWMVGIIALALGSAGIIKLENRSKTELALSSDRYSWKVLYGAIAANKQARLFFVYLVILLAAILGQDILLEPFGGEAFNLSVVATTRITSIWGGCFLVALLVAGALERRVNKRSVAKWGGIAALFGFILISSSPLSGSKEHFYTGVVFLGIGTGLSTVGNLSLMLEMINPGQVGLFMGAWGMANAFSRMIGSVLSGAVRDVVTQTTQNAVMGYVVVFGIEALMLLISLVLLRRINVGEFRQSAQSYPLVERAALVNEA